MLAARSRRFIRSCTISTASITFAEHPRQILRPEEAPDLLTANERKAELIQEILQTASKPIQETERRKERKPSVATQQEAAPRGTRTL